MASLAAGWIATFVKEVLRKLSITLVVCSLRKSQKSKLNFWVARISMYLCNTRTKQRAKKIGVSSNRAKELVIVEQCMVS